MQVDEFLLQGRVKRFGRGVVETDPGVSDRGKDPVGQTQIPERVTGVLSTSVSMHDELPLRGTATRDRHPHRLKHEIFTHMWRAPASVDSHRSGTMIYEEKSGSGIDTPEVHC